MRRTLNAREQVSIKKTAEHIAIGNEYLKPLQLRLTKPRTHFYNTMSSTTAIAIFLSVAGVLLTHSATVIVPALCIAILRPSLIYL